LWYLEERIDDATILSFLKTNVPILLCRSILLLSWFE
jgi:hypothetical protein